MFQRDPALLAACLYAPSPTDARRCQREACAVMSPNRRTRWRQDLRSLYLRARECPCFTALPCLKVTLPDISRPHVSVIRLSHSVQGYSSLLYVLVFLSGCRRSSGSFAVASPLPSTVSMVRRDTPVPPRIESDLVLPGSDIEVPHPGSPVQVSFLLTSSPTQLLIISMRCRHLHNAENVADLMLQFNSFATTSLFSSANSRLHLLQLRLPRPLTTLCPSHPIPCPAPVPYLLIIHRRRSSKKVVTWTQKLVASSSPWRGNTRWLGL